MTTRTATLDELKGRRLEDVLREVMAQQEVLTVLLDRDQSITIQPSRPLKPLPVLEGHVPEGWKDAVRE